MIRMINIAFCCLAIPALFSAPLIAGGGLFSAADSIDKTSEQIIFRQDGNVTTMMVRIRYAGEPQDFAWVIPVPTEPAISTGSDLLFTDLELATRPVFNLQRTGSSCAAASSDTTSVASTTFNDPVLQNVADLDVQVDQSLDVGPFEALVLQSDNSADLEQWLTGNGYTLSGRGALLLEEYVQAGMKFVALKLRSDQIEGSVVPVILRYQSDAPVIPIRLTEVSTVKDLGVLVWLLGEARAVPENYQHVVPNYTRLDWFADPRDVFGSYQRLISAAMDDVGGRGFATDFSGVIDDLSDHLVSPARFEDKLLDMQQLTDSEYLSSVQQNFFDSRVRNLIRSLLPLPEGQSETLYFSADGLALSYPAEHLAAARESIDRLIDEEIIDPVRRSRAIIDEQMVVTRLFTTLSAEDMTLDPRFVFNADMPDQQSSRQASISLHCAEEQTEWRVELGSGTGRPGELVMIGRGEPPMSAPDVDQHASWKTETTFARGAPVVNTQHEFDVVPINMGRLVALDDSVEGGSSGVGAFGLVLFLLLPAGRCFRRRSAR